MRTQANRSLLVIGECMMELSADGNSYARAFAGDTYNCAVYAKHRHEDIDVQILTAIGSDPVSRAMVAQWDRDHIGHSLVMTSESAHPGIYAISTDDDGERSFTYWRKDSAATELMALMTEDTRQAIAQFNCIFFSGITLAILPDEDKAELIALIAVLKEQGKTIAFDPNYRSVLWRNADHAAHWLTQAYRLTDVALPGLADHNEIFGHQCNEDVRAFLQDDLKTGEIVLKADADGVYGYSRNEDPVHLATTSDHDPRDTTGAGDSFAGTYLAERLMGASMPDAMRSGIEVASLVVQHRGAIIDQAVYREFVQGRYRGSTTSNSS